MAISSIQPIMSFNVSGFSAVMQATATSPPQLISVTTQTVTTPAASTVVTLGTVQPLSQPLFDASGRLTGGVGTATPGTGTTATGSVGRLVDANLALAGSASPDLTAMDATGVGAASLLASPTGTTGSLLNRSLAADVQTAVAGLDGSGGGGGLGTGPSTIGTVDLLNPNAAPLGAVTTPAVTGATAPPASALPNEAAQGAAAANTAAVSGAAIAPTITPFPPATPATPGAAAALTESAAAPATPAATPLVTATATVPGTEATTVLQQLVSDATARAVGRLTDPAFANVAAALYVSAGVFRNLSGAQQPLTGVGTADTLAVPPSEVTPARPIQPV